MIPHADIHVDDADAVGQARRAALRIAVEHDIDEATRGRIAIIATELATNLARHACRGRLLIGCHSSEDGCQLEVVSIDSGPGMAEVQRCLRDGPSTDTGLGAVRRLSSDFSMYSMADRGSVVLARVWTPALANVRANSPRQRFAHAGICFAPPGRAVSADGWDIDIDDAQGRARVVVVDGLHDQPAASSDRIRDAFGTARGTPGTTLNRLHAQFAGTAGASVAVIDADARAGVLRFSGVGEVAARVVGGALDARLPAATGRLGVDMPHAEHVECDWPAHSVVVLHSDGIRANWDLAHVPGLLQCDPAVVAGWLIRDFALPEADVALVVLKRT